MFRAWPPVALHRREAFVEVLRAEQSLEGVCDRCLPVAAGRPRRHHLRRGRPDRVAGLRPPPGRLGGQVALAWPSARWADRSRWPASRADSPWSIPRLRVPQRRRARPGSARSPRSRPETLDGGGSRRRPVNRGQLGGRAAVAGRGPDAGCVVETDLMASRPGCAGETPLDCGAAGIPRCGLDAAGALLLRPERSAAKRRRRGHRSAVVASMVPPRASWSTQPPSRPWGYRRRAWRRRSSPNINDKQSRPFCGDR